MRNIGQIHDHEGIVLEHLVRFNGDGTRSVGWEDLVRDPVFDGRSMQHSLSILACREYKENGPSQA